MAEEAGEVEDKPKKPILKIILLVVGILVLLGGTVAGTLFFSGFFSKKAAASAEAQLPPKMFHNLGYSSVDD